MFCDECQQRPVSVHITRIVNNQKTQLNLCEECAKKYQKQFSFGAGFEQNFSIHKFLAGLLDEDLENDFPVDTASVVKCEKCGMAYADFTKHGRLGCGQCYDTFRNRIDPLLERIHGSNVHVGKSPGKAFSQKTETAKDDNHLQEIDKLRKELQFLVDQELFEEAAKVRDRIKEMEAGPDSAS